MMKLLHICSPTTIILLTILGIAIKCSTGDQSKMQCLCKTYRLTRSKILLYYTLPNKSHWLFFISIIDMINPSPIMSNQLLSENVDLNLSAWEKWLLNNELQKRHNIIHPAILKMRSMSSLEKEKMKSERLTKVDGSVRHDLFSFSLAYKFS